MSLHDLPSDELLPDDDHPTGGDDGKVDLGDPVDKSAERDLDLPDAERVS